MSGGHWDYEQFRLRDLVERVADDEQLLKEFGPELGELVREVGNALGDTIHALDWHLSGDTVIQNKVAPLEDLRKRLRDILGS